jgi:hypothetical protein
MLSSYIVNLLQHTISQHIHLHSFQVSRVQASFTSAGSNADEAMASFNQASLCSWISVSIMHDLSGI